MPILIFLLLIFSARPIAFETGSHFFVWNVGQGQWTTFSDETTCVHFDMGGEFAPWNDIRRECGLKANRIYFSHWDWDHIGFAGKVLKILPHSCVAASPGGTTLSQKKIEAISVLPVCGKSAEWESRIHELHWIDRGRQKKSSNDASRVFILDGRVLVPGDSPSNEEKFWVPQISHPERIQLLILGHHGSRYSTSNFLLDRLTGLKAAISSARKIRYGHPHAEVVQRLLNHGLKVLRTEEWKTIKIDLPDYAGRNQYSPSLKLRTN